MVGTVAALFRLAGAGYVLAREGAFGLADPRDLPSGARAAIRVARLLERRGVSGIFNCGTGRAQTFNRLACAVINAVHGTQLTMHDAVAKGLIEYIPFPPQLQGKYQSFTEADLSKLRAAGYPGEFMEVEQGVAAYVKELQTR